MSKKITEDIIVTFDSIEVKTSKPVAYDSPDYQYPSGTRQDLSQNPRFDLRVLRLFNKKEVPQLRVMDLGCSGGVFVHGWIQHGHFAIGIEGSDYSKIYQRGAWPLISKFLFTADITENFKATLAKNEEQYDLDFHLVTAWEVMEHIPQDKLDGLIENIKNHLRPDGFFICSVSPRASNLHTGVPLHQTVQDMDWWQERFRASGLIRQPEIENYFKKQYVRGGRRGDSFNFVLTHASYVNQPLPKLKISDEFLDQFWYFSGLHKRLRRLVLGVDDL